MSDPIHIRLRPRGYDPAHPESSFELAPTNRRIPKEWEELGWKHPYSSRCYDNNVELCSACGWTTYDRRGSYLPRVRIVHTRGSMGLWSLGTKWLVKDQPNDASLGNEEMTWKFLREQPDHSIPLVKEMRRFTDPEDPLQLTLISRAPGIDLGMG